MSGVFSEVCVCVCNVRSVSACDEDVLTEGTGHTWETCAANFGPVFVFDGTAEQLIQDCRCCCTLTATATDTHTHSHRHTHTHTYSHTHTHSHRHTHTPCLCFPQQLTTSPPRPWLC